MVTKNRGTIQMDPAQDGVASPATPGTGKSKLETLPKEDLIKFAKKQMMLMQKAKSRCTGIGLKILISTKALTERLDTILLEKAETEQHCLSLKKENIKMKHEVEDSVTKMEDVRKEFEQSHRNYVKEIENLKNELMALHSKHNEDKASLQKELEEAINKQLELSEQLKFRCASEDNVQKLQEEIEKIRPAFEEQILCLQKQLEATTDEKKQEITHLQKVIETNSQHYQKDINTLQEELLQLKAIHQEEVKELLCQIEASAKEHEAEVIKLNQVKENSMKQCEANEKNIQEKHEYELENLRKATSDPYQDNQMCTALLEEDTVVEQVVNEKVKHLEDTLKELESQHSILKDEVTYMNNLKLKLEMDAQHIKDEFFHEREDLEFKINELLLAKEDQGSVIEKLKSELEDVNKQLCCAVEQHNKEVQSLKEQHQKEISELHETFLSDSEKEKLTLMFEIQGLKEQCENLQQEKQEAILNYESLREIMEILQTELGESAGKISQEFESMKQQQASDVHELQQKLRTAFNEKDALLETLNRLREENEKLLSQQELVPELETAIKNLQEKNEVYLVSLSQRDITLQGLEAKISCLTEERDEFVSKIKRSHEEMDNLHKKCETEERVIIELREKMERTTQYSSELEQKVNELTGRLDETLKEKDQNDQKLENLTAQIKTLSEDQEALSSEMHSLSEENNRLSSEKNQLSRDLDSLLSQKEGDLSLKEHITELEKKIQLMVEEQDSLSKLLENERVQKLFVKTQLYSFLKQMGLTVSEENEEQDATNVLQAVGESLARREEEQHSLVSQYEERVLQLEKEVKCLREENIAQREEFSSLLSAHEQEKVLLREELEETLSEKEALQIDLLEMKNANEKIKLENHNLLIQVEEASQTLCSKNDICEGEKSFIEEQENLRPLLEQRESELREMTAELISLKDYLAKSSSVKNDQLSSVKELEEKIGNLEKESKEKEEKINKLKLVAVKAKKELDSSRKETQTLREELEAVRSEKDQLSTSMRDLIQGAESYKLKLQGLTDPSEDEPMIRVLLSTTSVSTRSRARVSGKPVTSAARPQGLAQTCTLATGWYRCHSKCLNLVSQPCNLLLEYDKQSEQLDMEKERADNFEHHIEDLMKQLRNSTFQCEKLNSDNEDLLARIETLQSNAKLLEAQILEVQRAKAMVDKELETEKLQKEQKIKDAQQTTLMNMEIADYERLMKELNQKLTNKNSKIEDLEQEIKIQKQKQETLQEEITSLQSSVQQYEEQNTRIKQLLVRTKKELADSKQAETDHLILQASLKGELEASQQQVEVYKIQLAETTSEKHKIHEHLKTSADQHQRTLSAYQQRVTALQEESRAAKAEQAAIASEFESYKVRVHNVLKQQKNKSVSQAETEGAKQEREHLETLIDQLKVKLQDSQHNLQITTSEFHALQSEHDTLLERHNKMLQETVSKEAELREKLCSIQSENMMLKSEHAQTVGQLTSQNEALRSSFRDQVRHLQEEHRKTMETLQQQLSKVEAQLFQLKNEPATRSPASSHQPLKNLRERRSTDLPLLDMHAVTREEGEGMETTDTESVSSASTYTQSLEQLLSSPEPKLEPPSWHAEFTKEELVQKLSSTTKSADHLNGLLRETEATNAILMEQIKLLKSEIRRLERNQEREKSVANLEYLKNVMLQFIFLKPGSERERLLPVIDTMLQLSPEEKGRLAVIAQDSPGTERQYDAALGPQSTVQVDASVRLSWGREVDYGEFIVHPQELTQIRPPFCGTVSSTPATALESTGLTKVPRAGPVHLMVLGDSPSSVSFPCWVCPPPKSSALSCSVYAPLAQCPQQQRLRPPAQCPQLQRLRPPAQSLSCSVCVSPQPSSSAAASVSMRHFSPPHPHPMQLLGSVIAVPTPAPESFTFCWRLRDIEHLSRNRVLFVQCSLRSQSEIQFSPVWHRAVYRVKYGYTSYMSKVGKRLHWVVSPTS
ncbi:GRIP and coiled-coil domain-containing protein 2 [Tupaia chinensis]|uniref:GRIP and coiled-coil domain-containing protein 2 n=1 Tax=Tupaia chinensis TaxID=246437 RepID=L9LB91_TUPCH|nr:GRIP and coiled-coil domain-containing protein 2 [Tupaia chinensis]